MRRANGTVRLDITLFMDDPRDLAVIKLLMKVDPRRRTKRFKHLAYDGTLFAHLPRQTRTAAVHVNETIDETVKQTQPAQRPAMSSPIQAPAEYEPEIVDPSEFMEMIAQQANFFESKSWDGK